ncbi:MAG: LrgB family protein [Alphaproteobacteria bacterium]|nr:LrgB family protein [Alphaproteobacteria bacterium]
MIPILTNTIYFGFALTLLVYWLCWALHQKFRSPITTPLLVATFAVIAILLVFDIPYESYNLGAKYLGYFLIPATVCFAVPMYRQILLLKENMRPVLISVFIGCAVSVLTVVGLTFAFGLDQVIARSLAPVSVTTAIAIGITKELGGWVALTVFAVVITGILGAATGGLICRWLGIKNKMAQGLAIGNSSHAMGTTKALEMGEIEGATASLAILISGLMTVILGPLIIWLLL